MRFACIVLACLLLTVVTPFASADEDGSTSGDDGGYCVLISPSTIPPVFVDPSHCQIPPHVRVGG